MSLSPNYVDLNFRSLAQSDLPQLHLWLNADHMRRFYQRSLVTLAQVTEKYGPRIRGEVPTKCHLILFKGQPIGKIQCYRNSDYPNYAREIGVTDGVSIDYFIGEPSALGKGLGALLVRGYLDTVVFQSFDEETRCYTCHEIENKAAITCSKRAGFKEYRQVVEAGASCSLLVYERPRASRPDL